jgi:hypothetical protein
MGRVVHAQSGRALWSGAVSWAHLSIASSGEDKADWSSLRWRSSLRTVRRLKLSLGGLGDALAFDAFVIRGLRALRR